MSGQCRECSSHASTMILLIVLILVVMLVIAFFEWQAMRDPRIGSPLVLVMRLLETLGIFSLSVARWPGSIPVFLSITSLVNVNTEVFQVECLLGRPHPTRAALTYVCGIPVLMLVLLLFYPLLKLVKHCICYDRGVTPSLESMCEPLMPGKISPGTKMPFTTAQALMAATFKEHTMIALTVSLLGRAHSERRCPVDVDGGLLGLVVNDCPLTWAGVRQDPDLCVSNVVRLSLRFVDGRCTHWLAVVFRPVATLG